MFSRFWKDREHQQDAPEQLIGRLLADSNPETVDIQPTESEQATAEPTQPIDTDAPVEPEQQEPPEAAQDSSDAAAPEQRSEEAELLQEVLQLFREHAATRDPDHDDGSVGLTLDGVALPGYDDPHVSVELLETEFSATPAPVDAPAEGAIRLSGPRKKGRRLAKPAEKTKTLVTPEQRLLLLDTWSRSGLSAGDFAALVGVSKHTLYKWKQLFSELGPEGLMDQRRERKGKCKLPELSKRAILMMKQANPEWGCQRISDMLSRGPALPASPSTVARVLKEAGYQLVEEATRRHPPKVRRFERAKPNQLWQTDLFTFVLKRQNRRLYLVAFLDDYSRFLVSFGLTASATTAQVIEILEAGIASHGVPEEVLTDNGPQYVTWRGKSRFTKHLEKRGVRQIVARPKRPQTLGKIERFWGTLWREFLEAAIFTDLEDARRRIAFFIDYYNFSRVHRGIEGLVPADRFFQAAPEVLRTLKDRVSANALQLARRGAVKKPFYVTGQVDGQSFSVHSDGERLILRREGEEREEVELTSPAKETEPEPPVEPLCADGSLPSCPGEPADQPPLLPGESVIPLESEQASQDDRDAETPNDGKGGDA